MGTNEYEMLKVPLQLDFSMSRVRHISRKKLTHLYTVQHAVSFVHICYSVLVKHRAIVLAKNGKEVLL